MNYTFDPRMLSVRKVWSGGFLNLNAEHTARGKELASTGSEAKIHLEGSAILQPLASDGTPVDFEFKEPDAHDHAATQRYLWDDIDFMDRLATLDAEYLGHRLQSETGDPAFYFRVGSNVLAETISISDSGALKVTLIGKIHNAQKFLVSKNGLSEVTVSGGRLVDGVWEIPAGESNRFTLQARLAGDAAAPSGLSEKENWEPQELVTRPAEQGRRPIQVPAGYSLEDWKSPVDLLGREQLFEPTGIAVAKDGTIVFATRTAGIWRIRDKKWSLFAEGAYEALGVTIEDDKGDVIVVAQKPELTRMRDTDGDGRADRFETVCDDFGFHANYHEFTHGPVRDAEGNYYFNLNLAEYGDDKVSWKAGGDYMGSMGGFRGWSCRVTPEGKFEPFAMGLRSPAGMAVAPDGRLWYTENQGEYVGSSRLVPLEQGKFYGHPSGLVSLPGMKPDSKELNFSLWENKLRKGAVWLPHNRLANSPGSPAWDLTSGRFGPFDGQMFIGDQTLSQLTRVIPEQVDGVDQGCAILFAKGLASGVMRPAFLPDGSLLLGQTGRGWAAVGGGKSGLQRMVYDGKTIPADIARVTAAPDGFVLHFTQPIDGGITEKELHNKLKVWSWFYENTRRYGSPETDQRKDKVSAVTLSEDRTALHIRISEFGTGDKWLDRIYDIKLTGSDAFFGDTKAWPALEAFYTLRAIPAER